MAEHPSVELYRLIYQRALLIISTSKWAYRTNNMILYKKDHDNYNFSMHLIVDGNPRMYRIVGGLRDGIYDITNVTLMNHDAKLAYQPGRRKSHTQKSMIFLSTILRELDTLECFTLIVAKPFPNYYN